MYKSADFVQNWDGCTGFRAGPLFPAGSLDPDDSQAIYLPRFPSTELVLARASEARDCRLLRIASTDNNCQRCSAGHCRLSRGSCDWVDSVPCKSDMDQLRTEDVDAWAKLNRLVKKAESPDGLNENHVAPMRRALRHALGEIKTTGHKKWRLYYGEPDQDERLVVGLCLRAKQTSFKSQGAVTTAQNKDIRDAVSIFVRWLEANGMTSTR